MADQQTVSALRRRYGNLLTIKDLAIELDYSIVGSSAKGARARKTVTC